MGDLLTGAAMSRNFLQSAIALCLALVSSVLTLPALAQDSTSYTYDALGRLTNTAVSGGPNTGVSTTTVYDPATNRVSYLVSGVPTPTVANFSFEQPVTGNFQYGPFSGSGYTFSTRAGVATNGSAWGFASAPLGSQVAFLQSYTDVGATITLDVSGLTPGQSYAFRYQAAQRPGFGTYPVQVTFAGANLGAFTAPSTSFSQITTVSFTAASATGQVTFSTPVTNGDLSSAIDNVTVIPGGSPPSPQGATPGIIPNASFEQPNVGSSFQYNPSVADNYFGGGAGVSGNGSAWGFPTAPAGSQVAFLQDASAVIAMNVSGLTVGATYTVKFKASIRLTGFPANQTYVAFQNNNLGVYTPSAGFQQFTTTSFVASASTGVLTFSGQTGGGSGTGIDDVQITSP